MPKEKLTVVEAEFSLEEIAAALKLTPEDVTAKFRDPRITSWFAEIWGERLFGYKKHMSSNHAGSDGAIQMGDIGRFDISVRCFNNNGIKFQKSKFIGSGRKATPDDLIESIESVERYVLVDLRRFPLLSFYPIDSKALLRLIRNGKLTTSGIGQSRFDQWVTDSFDVTTRRIALGRATGALG
jgi:hypothetical protein